MYRVAVTLEGSEQRCPGTLPGHVPHLSEVGLVGVGLVVGLVGVGAGFDGLVRPPLGLLRHFAAKKKDSLTLAFDAP